MRSSTDKSLFEQIRRAVSRRKLLIASVFALIVFSGMTATFLITPKYEAAMSILVSRDRVDPRISPSEKTLETAPTSISDEEFNSELELIQSGEVIAGAVRVLNLIHHQTPKNDSWISELRTKIKAMFDDFTSRASAKTEDAKNLANEKSPAGDFAIEKAVNRIANNLEVVPVKKSRIIKINYTDTDPLRAKNTLEEIYRQYVELHVQLSEKRQAGQLFNEQTDAFNRKLKSSTDVLKNFDVQNEVSGAQIGVQRELLLKQFYETQTQLGATQTEMVETEHRITDLQAKVNAQPEQLQTGSVSKYVSAIDRMKEELAQLEQQKTQLLQKYQPNSRPVRESEGRIVQLKKSIAEETANPPQEKSFALNDLRRKLVADLYAAQTSLVALKEREKKLSPLVAKLRGQTASLNSRSIERESLERARNVNEEAYLLYQKKARESEISQVLNKEQVVNFAVVDAPSTDGEAKNPKPLMNLIVLIAVGLTAGLTSAICLEKLPSADNDDFAVSAYEIEQRWNLPILATISVDEPEKRTKNIALPRRSLLLPADRKERKNNRR